MTNSLPACRIVRAGVEHLELVAPLFDAYRQFYRLAPDLTGARAYLAERLRNGEAVVFLALEEGGAPAPLGFMLLYPTFSSLSMRCSWILNDLYVVPGARRRGVAHALLAAARRLAVETGAAGLSLETARDNLPAQRLYEQLGWKRDQEFYRYSLAV